MGVALAVPVLAGCALHATKAQADSVDAFYECRFEGRIAANVELERVEPDGRVVLGSMDSAAGLREALACWEEKMRARGHRAVERLG